jgi:hypothetical protein
MPLFAACHRDIPPADYMVRLYRPRAEILNGYWKLLEAQPAQRAMSAFGTKRTFRDRVPMSAFELAGDLVDDRAILLEGFFELIRRHGALAKLIVEEIRKEPNTRPRD